MSIAAYEALQAARREALENQQTCACCGQKCKNGDHLFMHILLRHEIKKEK